MMVKIRVLMVKVLMVMVKKMVKVRVVDGGEMMVKVKG